MSSKRIVRKRSLSSKLKSYPLDLLLSLNEQRELIDWDAHSKTIALPLGFILTVLYFFIRLWQDNTVVEKKQKYFNYDRQILKDSKYFNKTESSSMLPRIFFTLQLIIISINLINTASFLLKTKKYSIFNKASLLHSSSARRISKDGKTNTLVDQILFWRKSDEPEVESYWELTMWNPSKFSTYLFISFPPFNILFLYLSQSSFTNLLFLTSTSIVLYFVIIKGYLVLIEDKQVLYQETFDEYQRKYVNPKLSVAKREVAIDATHGPYDNTVEYYSPGRTEKVFKTHDYKGRESVEAFQQGEFTPVKKSTPLRKSVFTPRRSEFNSRSYNPSPLSRKSHPSGF